MTGLTVIVCVAFDHRAPSEELKRFKSCVAACSCVETLMEVSGTYDLIAQVHLPSLADYLERMEQIAPQLALYALKVESSFVGRRLERSSRGRTLWVPCREGRRQIDAGMINKIVAEGDYMRICMDDSECLVHDTIRHLLTQLDGEQFIQLHRSSVVRVDFIDRLTHSRRRWIARLRDGTEQAVAKSHVADVLRLIETGSPRLNNHSATEGRITEALAQANEIRMKLGV